ncbi:TauD/TfdA family dioxygenase [Leucothrix pacifica]|uniref:Gamma-butyrobetaine,2-oxoglutarate dioxygenase n=1 Tax=Leucothrix pacifica TaxID=1247513 RepID=A0A317CRF5_9GAMM|nr:TauD/TfdA family dioxygenase [Leucothrix pacifica]PWQ98882.1 gamma-butyrobetaine,2-oxoglutarate dioxygenase [Leucothrix pacifica]
MPVLKENGLQLTMPNGDQAYFNYYWLRDNCPSSWDEDTQERAFDILAEPDHLKADVATLDDDALHITWPDGHQSQYPLAWLSHWYKNEGGNVAGHGDIAVRARRSWYADHYEDIARFSYDDLVTNPALVADWTEVLLDEGIALLTAMPDTDDALQEVCELIGTVRPSFSGYAFNVRSELKPVNLAYTSKALELHTDLPPEELAPGLQFLHCRENDADGGRSLFVDATSVANALREQYPEYFKILTDTEVPFRYTTDSQDVRARQRIIEIDPDNGEVSGVSFSQHLSDVFDMPQQFMDQFYPAFRKFGHMMQDSQYLMKFRLNAGECIVFDNHRIAHGREAFTEGSGARFLRGCYVDRGEMRSTYRVRLANQH